MLNSQKLWKSFLSLLSNSSRIVLLLFIGIYRSIGTTHLGGACRFQPSCSEYAVQATKTYPPLTALKMILKRIIKCRPGGPFGLDPLPDYGDKINAKR